MARPFLNLTTRTQYATLLDGAALTHADSDAPAIIYVETERAPIIVTRAEFQHAVGVYAAALAGKGIHPRDLVIIAHTQNLESIYLFWGALRLGAIPSMFPTLTEKLDPTVYMESMAALVAHSGAAVILTTDDFAPQLAQIAPCPVYGSSALAAAADHPLSPNASPNEIAFLQHSSGTTGLQKGVALTHDAVLNQLASYSSALQLSPADVIVSWLPLYHDMGLIAGFILPLVTGIPLVLMSPFDWARHPAMLMRAIHDHGGTLCWLPNFAYNHCARRIRVRDMEGISLATMRAFINCSEPVRHDSHELFYGRFQANGVTRAMLGVSYAMAENTFAVTQTPLGEPPHLDTVDRHALEETGYAAPAAADDPNAQINISCGLPITGAAVRVLADDGMPLPPRRVGEIAIRSDSMLTGYYKRDDLNAALWFDGWYRTGDLGYVDEARRVYISGRKKDLIITAGKNVFPQDIEAVVNGVAGVHAGRAVAFGVFDEREGTEVIAVVAEADVVLTPETQSEIERAIRQAIAAHTTVTAAYVQVVDDQWLIKTSSGKIARAANRAKWLAERALV